MKGTRTHTTKARGTDKFIQWYLESALVMIVSFSQLYFCVVLSLVNFNYVQLHGFTSLNSYVRTQISLKSLKLSSSLYF